MMKWIPPMVGVSQCYWTCAAAKESSGTLGKDGSWQAYNYVSKHVVKLITSNLDRRSGEDGVSVLPHRQAFSQTHDLTRPLVLLESRWVPCSWRLLELISKEIEDLAGNSVSCRAAAAGWLVAFSEVSLPKWNALAGTVLDAQWCTLKWKKTF